jgi:hypothetical protein
VSCVRISGHQYASMLMDSAIQATRGAMHLYRCTKNAGRGSIGQTLIHGIMSQSTKNKDLPCCRKRQATAHVKLKRVDWTKQDRLEIGFTVRTDRTIGEHPSLDITRASGGLIRYAFCSRRSLGCVCAYSQTPLNPYLQKPFFQA